MPKNEDHPSVDPTERERRAALEAAARIEEDEGKERGEARAIRNMAENSLSVPRELNAETRGLYEDPPKFVTERTKAEMEAGKASLSSRAQSKSIEKSNEDMRKQEAERPEAEREEFDRVQEESRQKQLRDHTDGHGGLPAGEPGTARDRKVEADAERVVEAGAGNEHGKTELPSVKVDGTASKDVNDVRKTTKIPNEPFAQRDHPTEKALAREGLKTHPEKVLDKARSKSFPPDDAADRGAPERKKVDIQKDEKKELADLDSMLKQK
jgi:hypothetical protein